MSTAVQPEPPRPLAGGAVWTFGWLLFLLAIVAVFALVAGPVAYWTEELLPPATGGIGDGVIAAGVRSGLLVGLGTVALSLTGLVRVVGRRLRTRRAEETLASDSRPPVLYLRPFRDDEPFASAAESLEESLASILRDVGPVIAIGRPNERLPPLGAARLYRDDDTWQATVQELMTRAAAVVMRAGTSPGVVWELSTIVRHVPPTRFLLALPPALRGGDAETWRRFREVAAAILPHPPPDDVKGAHFVTFDAAWAPSVVVPPKNMNPISARSSVRAMLRPFCDRNGLALRGRAASDISVEAAIGLGLVFALGQGWMAPEELYWRDLTVPGRFTVSMPGKYFETDTTTQISPGVQARVHEYGVIKRSRSLEFRIALNTYSGISLADPIRALDGMRDAIVADVKGSLASETPLTLGSSAGRAFTIAVPARDSRLLGRLFVVDPQRTVLIVAGVRANGTEDTAARRFVESLRLP